MWLALCNGCLNKLLYIFSLFVKASLLEVMAGAELFFKFLVIMNCFKFSRINDIEKSEP